MIVRNGWLFGEITARNSFAVIDIEKRRCLACEDVVSTKFVIAVDVIVLVVIVVKIDHIGVIRVRHDAIRILALMFQFDKPPFSIFD